MSAAITWDEAASDAASSITRRLSESGVIQSLPEDEAKSWIKQDVLALHGRVGKYAESSAIQHFLTIGAVALLHCDTGEFSWAEEAEMIAELAARKHHDYGTDNITTFGVEGIAVRMNDKLARIRNLEERAVDAEGDTLANFEALHDSWVDLVGYSIVGIMLLEGTFVLPLEVDSPVKPDTLGSATPEQVHEWLQMINGFGQDPVRDIAVEAIEAVQNHYGSLQFELIGAELWVRVA